MIQAPFNSSCVALQYKTGTKFFHRAVPELHGIKNQKISVPVWHSSVSSRDFSKNEPRRRVLTMKLQVSRGLLG